MTKFALLSKLDHTRSCFAQRISEILQRLTGKVSKQEDVEKYLSRSTFHLLIIQLLSILSTFFISLLLARILGAEGYGVLSYAFSWVTLLGVFANLGLGVLIVREVAKYNTQQNWSYLKGLLIWSKYVVVGISIVLLLLAEGIIFFIEIPGDVQMRYGLMLAIPALPFLALTSLNKGTLQGLQQMIAGQLPDKTFRPLLFLFLVVCCYILIQDQFNVYWAVGLNVIAFAVMFLGSTWLLQRHSPVREMKVESKFQTTIWLKSGLAFLLIHSMFEIETQTDIIMLGSLADSQQVGIYNIAKRLSKFVTIFHFILGIALAPVISRYYVKQTLDQLQQLITKSIRWVFILSFIPFLIFIIGGFWVLSIFGNQFITGHTSLLILSATQMVIVISGSVSYLLYMTGHEREAAKSVGVGVVVNIVLNALLIPQLGMTGAAIATFVSVICWNAMMVVVVAKKTGIHSTIFGRWKKDR